MWYGRNYGMALGIPNADRTDGPLAPRNYHLWDVDGRWIGNDVRIIEDEVDEEEESGESEDEEQTFDNDEEGEYSEDEEQSDENSKSSDSDIEYEQESEEMTIQPLTEHQMEK